MKDAEIRKILAETHAFILGQLVRDPRQHGVIEKALNILSVQSAALSEIARGSFTEIDFNPVVVDLAEQSRLVGMEPPAADAVRGG